MSAYLTAKIDKILDLAPDLVLGFSDLQADIASQLIRAGVSVHVFNQRSVTEILQMIAMVGAMVGAHGKTAALLAQQSAVKPTKPPAHLLALAGKAVRTA